MKDLEVPSWQIGSLANNWCPALTKFWLRACHCLLYVTDSRVWALNLWSGTVQIKIVHLRLRGVEYIVFPVKVTHLRNDLQDRRRNLV